MKSVKEGQSYFFVDESGDPTFYDAKGNLIVGRPGCSPILIIGFIETQDPRAIRRAVLDVHQEVLTEPYFKRIPSLHKTAIAFHAKDDAPEIRYLFYKRIKELEFKAQFIVARKIEKVFRNDFRADEDQFYDHLVSRAFTDVLHRYKQNSICLSKRGSRDRQEPLLQAILKAKATFEEKHHIGIDTNISAQVQSPKGEPCLSVIDYMNWAVYRAYTKQEMRYCEFVNDKVSWLLDVYDWEAYPANCYYRGKPKQRKKANIFDISKATPL